MLFSPLKGLGMEPKTQVPDAKEFCLVLTPTLSAPTRASEAIRQRFGALADEIRSDLAAVVGELVQNSVENPVERGPRKPIVVMVRLGTDAIRGEVSDHGDLVPFEMPLVRPVRASPAHSEAA
jgi:anti-sigma regulatory factor (Ser/Thr protein kinase)